MKRGLWAILAVALLSGCARMQPMESRAAGADEPLLDFMVRLAEADGTGLTRMGHAFDPPMEATARPGRALRHALWQGMPGHPGYDPDAARERLRGLLAMPDALTGDERDLVRLHLAQLDRYMRLHRASEDLSRANRELREQIEALTDLEREMGGNGTNGDE